ncbi:MAG: DUF4288 domain-containing protein [Chitinophagaceae bacterium]|nr:DUF4288 domain-containing protein [Chitinophagaceae bacterium]
MNWYLAKIIYRIVCGDGEHTAQFDEQLRLIAATDEEQAFIKAIEIGEKEEDNFMNMRKETVYWQFINVAELYRLSDLIDGAELYSNIRETENADHYIDTTHKKAAHIQEKTTHRLLQLI